MVGKITALALAFLWILTSPKTSLAAEPVSSLIIEAHIISSEYGHRIWTGLHGAPFASLILFETREHLLCADHVPGEFTLTDKQPLPDCTQFQRPSTGLPTSMQATFPIANPAEPVIVIGAPGLSEANPAAWIATFLHEHFHQYQMSWPGYYDALAALNLARGDETGMWALAYPFPYENAQVQKSLSLLGALLADVLTEPDAVTATYKARSYARLRPLVLGVLAKDDRTYLEFQLWQEGVARYTELALAEYAASGTHTGFSPEHDYAALSANLRRSILAQLQDNQLAKNQRVYFYAHGAAESLVLDMIQPDWREKYFSHSFSLAEHFELKN